MERQIPNKIGLNRFIFKTHSSHLETYSNLLFSKTFEKVGKTEILITVSDGTQI